jgi:hypothetical protein
LPSPSLLHYNKKGNVDAVAFCVATKKKKLTTTIAFCAATKQK